MMLVLPQHLLTTVRYDMIPDEKYYSDTIEV